MHEQLLDRERGLEALRAQGDIERVKVARLQAEVGKQGVKLLFRTTSTHSSQLVVSYSSPGNGTAARFLDDFCKVPQVFSLLCVCK